MQTEGPTAYRAETLPGSDHRLGGREPTAEDSDRTLNLQAGQAAVTTPPESARIHYLDNLRALAMLLGVYLHAALAYAEPARSLWLATDTRSSVTVDASIWFIHLFRMGLFFLLSGYFARLVVERKGIKQFLIGRALRVGLPMVIFYPLLLGAMTIVIVFSLSYLESPAGLMGMIASAVTQRTEATNGPPPGTMHLWFLYYLLQFSLVAACCCRWRLATPAWLSRRRWILGFAPLLLLPGIIGAGVPLPAPESFLPTWWPFAFYGLFYFAGWRLFGRESRLNSWMPYVAHLVTACVGLFVVYYVAMPVLNLSLLVPGASPLSVWRQAIGCVLTAYLSVGMTLAALLLGKKFMAGRSAGLAFVSDASYWTYLVHLPVVIFLQTLLIPLDWPAWVKLVATTLGTLAPCLATYVVFVRYTPVGWLIHGRRAFP
jgi:peptidoglycan/LPS O-acetylase OafA/YrhL